MVRTGCEDAGVPREGNMSCGGLKKEMELMACE